VPDLNQPPDDFRPGVPLTPAACLEAVAARLDRLHQGTAGMLLRAIPVKTGGTGKVYGGFVDAALKDPRTNDLIDCRIPEALARDLECNREAVFAGLLRSKPRRAGTVKPESIKCDVRAALQAPKPKVTVITGVHSVAVDDVRAQRRDAEADLNLDVVRVPLSRVKEVVRALRQVADGSFPGRSSRSSASLPSTRPASSRRPRRAGRGAGLRPAAWCGQAWRPEGGEPCSSPRPHRAESTRQTRQQGPHQTKLQK
jgi:hypothetical protein